MRRRLALSLAVAALAASIILPGVAIAQGIAERPSVMVPIELAGGSRIMGVLKFKSITMEADFGRVDFEPSKINSLSFGDRRLGRGNLDTIVTTSGSRIKGKIVEESFEFETEGGTVKLDRSKPLAEGDAPVARPDAPKQEAKPDPKPEPKEATDEDRATPPRPIPRFITQPSALRVTKISAGRPPTCGLPPFHPGPIRKSVESSMNLRVIKP